MRSISCFCFALLTCFCFGQEKILDFYNFSVKTNSYQLDWTVKNRDKKDLPLILDSLSNLGFYTLKLDSVSQNKVYLTKGKLYRSILVKNDSIFSHEIKDSFFLTRNIDSLKQTVHNNYSAKGFPFSQLKIKPLGLEHDVLKVEFNLTLFPKRTIDKIKLVGYEKLDRGFVKHQLGIKLGDVYNENNLREITKRIQSSRFITEVRPAQTLFATDSTVLYLYLKKQSSNYFDGILGFGNDENGDFQLNGNVDLQLNNNFNGLEQISLHWQATPDRNTTLRLSANVPYLFKTAFGSNTQFELFRQDSVFVNTKLYENLYYQINPNSNFGINLFLENSNFVLNNNPLLNENFGDYNKTGFGIRYHLLIPAERRILEGKSHFSVSGNTIQRRINDLNDNNQFEVDFSAYKLFNLYKNHYIKALLEGSGLFSQDDSFVENELYRFGGFGSLRGFNEQSLLATQYGIASLEYRFIPNDGFYVSVFADYGFLENQLSRVSNNLMGIGTGFSFLSKIGVFNISYAVGKFSNSNFDFNNSKVHFGLISTF